MNTQVRAPTNFLTVRQNPAADRNREFRHLPPIPSPPACHNPPRGAESHETANPAISPATPADPPARPPLAPAPAARHHPQWRPPRAATRIPPHIRRTIRVRFPLGTVRTTPTPRPRAASSIGRAADF
ncbi:hypothetical protein GCM10023205_11870 [Yinghuangia aomiensis]|uniref:Uncharacterized protein n=1 Tax=Yinghuangia aomiensis TaxID=676205 RepID=A0ABP9GTJ3_9ACTN